jgi:hypothetical protein
LDHERITLLPDYSEWLDRVGSTYESVSFCCLHRLRDRTLAQAIGLRVVAGLVERPTIFQFSGLPYSGRIGNLAERWIAEAKAGRLEPMGSWPEFRGELSAVAVSYQETFIAVCVWGRQDADLAVALGCTERAAREGREIMLAHFEGLARRALTLQPAGESH